MTFINLNHTNNPRSSYADLHPMQISILWRSASYGDIHLMQIFILCRSHLMLIYGLIYTYLISRRSHTEQFEGLSIYPQIESAQIGYRNLALKINKYHCVNKEKKNIF